MLFDSKKGRRGWFGGCEGVVGSGTRIFFPHMSKLTYFENERNSIFQLLGDMRQSFLVFELAESLSSAKSILPPPKHSRKSINGANTGLTVFDSSTQSQKRDIGRVLPPSHQDLWVGICSRCIAIFVI